MRDETEIRGRRQRISTEIEIKKEENELRFRRRQSVRMRSRRNILWVEEGKRRRRRRKEEAATYNPNEKQKSKLNFFRFLSSFRNKLELKEDSQREVRDSPLFIPCREEKKRDIFSSRLCFTLPGDFVLRGRQEWPAQNRNGHQWSSSLKITSSSSSSLSAPLPLFHDILFADSSSYDLLFFGHLKVSIPSLSYLRLQQQYLLLSHSLIIGMSRSDDMTHGSPHHSFWCWYRLLFPSKIFSFLHFFSEILHQFISCLLFLL